MMIALGYLRCSWLMVWRSLWSAASVTEQVLTTHTSGTSFGVALWCPRNSNSLPSALLSAKFNLHPNVTNRTFIVPFFKRQLLSIILSIFVNSRLYCFGLKDDNFVIIAPQNNDLFNKTSIILSIFVNSKLYCFGLKDDNFVIIAPQNNDLFNKMCQYRSVHT